MQIRARVENFEVVSCRMTLYHVSIIHLCQCPSLNDFIQCFKVYNKITAQSTSVSVDC